MFSLTECDQLEPQLQDAEECDRPTDDAVCAPIINVSVFTTGQFIVLYQHIKNDHNDVDDDYDDDDDGDNEEVDDRFVESCSANRSPFPGP